MEYTILSAAWLHIGKTAFCKEMVCFRISLAIEKRSGSAVSRIQTCDALSAVLIQGTSVEKRAETLSVCVIGGSATQKERFPGP